MPDTLAPMIARDRQDTGAAHVGRASSRPPQARADCASALFKAGVTGVA
jgi:hypothetical protein